MRIYRSAEAIKRLGDYGFQRFWDDLARECRWPTVFQGWQYAQTWYRCYQDAIDPVLVCSSGSETPFLFALGLGESGLVPVGARQAEYQAWLSLDDTGRSIERCLQLLTDSIAWDRLILRYVPPGFPLQGLPDDRASVTPAARPLMGVSNDEQINTLLKNKTIKNSINRLKRLGLSGLEYLSGPERVQIVLDEAIPMYDFRQGATHGIIPFEGDSHKRAFALAMASYPALTHCTVLRVKEQIIAAHIGRISGSTVHLGLLAISPVYSKCSPGSLLILLLGRLLHDQGFQFLDLTPGGDEWKARFASEHDSAHALIIHRSSVSYRRERILQSVGRAVRAGLRLANVSPSSLRAKLGTLRSARTVLRRTAEQIWHESSVELYQWRRSDIPPHPPEHQVQRNSLRDLLDCRPGCKQSARFEFLSSALHRLESGKEYAYTLHVAEEVVAVAWAQCSAGEFFVTETQEPILLTANSVVFHSFVLGTMRVIPPREWRSLLIQMLRDFSAGHPPADIYALFSESDVAAVHEAQLLGFTSTGTLYKSVRLGRIVKGKTGSIELLRQPPAELSHLPNN
jgi:CelD/BcsL family acetyltransferase involved in cellulose biosynthesis